MDYYFGGGREGGGEREREGERESNERMEITYMQVHCAYYAYKNNIIHQG